jgi:hypothetical protein
MNLSKAYLIFGSEERISVVNNLPSTNYVDFLDTLYYDTAGRIRKIVSHKCDGGCKSGDISYFDADGYLRFNLFYDYDQGEGINREIYMKKNKLLLSKGETYDDNNGNPIALSFFIKKGKISKEIKGIPFGHTAHLDSLKKQYNNNLEMPKNCFQVVFSLPEIGSSTFINAINTEVRTSANFKSQVIDTLKMGQDVRIIESTKDENVREIGTYPWYKIEYTTDFGNTLKTGYVFGAFLEPVEIEIK